MWFRGSMGFRSVAVSSAVAFLCIVTNASAFDGTAKYAAPEYGKTLPPVGFVKFCAKNPEDCKTRGKAQQLVSMSTERWDQLYQTNTYRAANLAAAQRGDREDQEQSEKYEETELNREQGSGQ